MAQPSSSTVAMDEHDRERAKKTPHLDSDSDKDEGEEKSTTTSFLTPNRIEAKKLAKAERKRKQKESARIDVVDDGSDAVDYGDTPKTPKTGDTDLSDAVTEIKYNSTSQKNRDDEYEALAIAQRIADAQAEKDIADATRAREKEKF